MPGLAASLVRSFSSAVDRPRPPGPRPSAASSSGRRENDLRGLSLSMSGIGPELFRAACRLEGLVSKRSDQPYQAGPSRSWLKVKNWKASGDEPGEGSAQIEQSTMGRSTAAHGGSTFLSPWVHKITTPLACSARNGTGVRAQVRGRLGLPSTGVHNGNRSTTTI